MSNTSPGITIPGIPSGGNYGYTATTDSLIYDPVTHIGGIPPAAGVVAQAQANQNQFNTIFPANVGNMENGLTTNWNAQGGTIANVTTGPAHSGTHAMQFTGNGAGPNGYLLYIGSGGLAIPASYIGYQISCSAWAYNPSAPLRQLRMLMAFYTAGQVLIPPVVVGSFITEIQNAWMLAPPLTVVVPATTAGVAVYCGGPGIHTTGEVRYFDDFALAPT